MLSMLARQALLGSELFSGPYKSLEISDPTDPLLSLYPGELNEGTQRNICS